MDFSEKITTTATTTTTTQIPLFRKTPDILFVNDDGNLKAVGLAKICGSNACFVCAMTCDHTEAGLQPKKIRTEYGSISEDLRIEWEGKMMELVYKSLQVLPLEVCDWEEEVDLAELCDDYEHDPNLWVDTEFEKYTHPEVLLEWLDAMPYFMGFPPKMKNMPAKGFVKVYETYNSVLVEFIGFLEHIIIPNISEEFLGVIAKKDA